jgi:hypothetical protein
MTALPTNSRRCARHHGAPRSTEGHQRLQCELAWPTRCPRSTKPLVIMCDHASARRTAATVVHPMRGLRISPAGPEVTCATTGSLGLPLASSVSLDAAGSPSGAEGHGGARLFVVAPQDLPSTALSEAGAAPLHERDADRPGAHAVRRDAEAS